MTMIDYLHSQLYHRLLKIMGILRVDDFRGKVCNGGIRDMHITVVILYPIWLLLRRFLFEQKGR